MDEFCYDEDMKKLLLIIGVLSLIAASCNLEKSDVETNNTQQQNTQTNQQQNPPASPPQSTPTSPPPTPPINNKESVAINSISPTSGRIGTKIRIVGTDFTATGNTVHFGLASNSYDSLGSIYPGYSATNNTIEFIVPTKDKPMCPLDQPMCPIRAPDPITPGTYYIFISNSQGASNAVSFTVTD
jgi:hypothetical protein